MRVYRCDGVPYRPTMMSFCPLPLRISPPGSQASCTLGAVGGPGSQSWVFLLLCLHVPGRKNGRPTIFAQEVLDKLEYVFALGGTDKEACLYADVSPAALYKYQEKNPDFVERKEMLKEAPILAARESVIKHLKRNPELALKYLERKRKDEFSLKQEIEQTGETSVTITYVIPQDPPRTDDQATSDEAEAA